MVRTGITSLQFSSECLEIQDNRGIFILFYFQWGNLRGNLKLKLQLFSSGVMKYLGEGVPGQGATVFARRAPQQGIFVNWAVKYPDKICP